MADLDDFFAKKDKKKKTKKFPKANTEVLATKLEESARREQEADMKAAMATGDSTYNKENHAEGKDEEWKEYEEFKKDYSGLKIETLKIDENNPIGDDEETELNEDGEKVRVKKSDGGPWNKAAGQAGAKNEEEPDSPPSTPEPQPHHVETAPSSGSQKSAYVPPHMRGSAGGSSSPSSSGPSSVSRAQQRRNKAAPDISNEFYFPSLAAAVADGPPAKGSERSEAVFERVKAGGGQQHSKSSDGPKLSLDNKFAALGDH